MAMPMMRCACLLACSRASSSMRLTMWAASMRASFSIDRDQLVAWPAAAVRPAICSSRSRSSATMRVELVLLLLELLLAAADAPCRAGVSLLLAPVELLGRLSRLSSFWVSRRSSALELGAPLARGLLELAARLEQLLLGRELGLAQLGLALRARRPRGGAPPRPRRGLREQALRCGGGRPARRRGPRSRRRRRPPAIGQWLITVFTRVTPP